MSNAQDITGYAFSNQDRLFFDTNVWLYIYGPQGSPADVRPQIYSKALASAIGAKSNIFLDVLVLGEFINRFARIEYDIKFPNKSKRPDFKKFRNSPAFRPIAQAIVSATHNILKFVARVESEFTNVDIYVLLSEFENGGHDFNDQIYINLCLSKNLILVTHDADFKGKSASILTANQNILLP